MRAYYEGHSGDAAYYQSQPEAPLSDAEKAKEQRRLARERARKQGNPGMIWSAMEARSSAKRR